MNRWVLLGTMLLFTNFVFIIVWAIIYGHAGLLDDFIPGESVVPGRMAWNIASMAVALLYAFVCWKDRDST